MPLNKKGKKVFRSFVARYGKKGKSYFYAILNKRRRLARKLKRKPPGRGSRRS